MNTSLDPDKIRQLLNRSLGQLEPSILSGLAAARLRALDAHAAHCDSPLLAGDGRHSLLRPREDHKLLYWGVALMLIVTLFGSMGYWDQLSEPEDDLDIAILTDELPIEMYID